MLKAAAGAGVVGTWGSGSTPPRYRGEAFADQAGIILGKIRPLSKTDFKVAQVFGDGSS